MSEKNTSIHLNLVVLRTPNLVKTLKFYEALGLTFQEEKHGDGPRHFACVMPRIVLEIFSASSRCDESTRVGFSVSSLEETQTRLIRFGFSSSPISSTEGIGRYIVARDPDNRAVLLVEK